MRATTDEFDVPAAGGQHLSRRSVLKAGAHAAWVVPAIQVVGAAPAIAASSCTTGVGAFSFAKVSAQWNLQNVPGDNKDHWVLTIIVTITDHTCVSRSAITAVVTAPWTGLQDHSTTKWTPKKSGQDRQSISYSSTQKTVHEGNVWQLEVSVRADDYAKHSGGSGNYLTVTIPGYPSSFSFLV